MRKNILIESQIPDETVEVLGDREALFQAINNLLDNVIKYNSEKGTATLHLYKDGENAVINVGIRL